MGTAGWVRGGGRGGAQDFGGAGVPGGRHCPAPSFRGGCRLPCRSGLLGSGWGGSAAGCSGAVPSRLPRQPQLAGAQAQGAAGVGMGPCAGGPPAAPPLGGQEGARPPRPPTAPRGLAQPSRRGGVRFGAAWHGTVGTGMAWRCPAVPCAARAVLSVAWHSTAGCAGMAVPCSWHCLCQGLWPPGRPWCHRASTEGWDSLAGG